MQYYVYIHILTPNIFVITKLMEVLIFMLYNFKEYADYLISKQNST